MPARWDSAIPLTESAAYGRCELCPRRCGAARDAGERGACGADARVHVARVGLHEWEEPPISGSAGSGTIFFSGCALKCAYCQNAAISRGEHGALMDAAELARACLQLQEAGAMNVNMVTPSHHAPTIREAIRLARRQGLHLPIIWNTSGYETVEAVEACRDAVDVYLTDMKYADAQLAGALSGAADYPQVALRAIGAMVAQTGPLAYDAFGGEERLVRGVVVRHMVLPGHADDSIRVVRLLHDRFGDSIRLSLMSQYTPVIAEAAQRGDERAARCLERFPELARTLSAEEYEAVLAAADELSIEDYFWQQGDAAQESFIPDFTL